MLAVSSDGGVNWQTDVRRLSGNVDAVNTWHNESVDLTPYQSSNTMIRFRGKASRSKEDADVDNVKIEGTLAGPPEISISDATATEGGSTWGFSDAIALDGSGISRWTWGVAQGTNGDLSVSFRRVISGDEVSSRMVKIVGGTGKCDH